MRNIWQDMRKARIKQAMNPVSVDFPKMVDMLRKDKDLRKMFLESMQTGQKEVGKLGLERAFMENVFTKEEWKTWQKKGLNLNDMGTVFQAYFNEKDGIILKDEKGPRRTIVLTTLKSNIYKNKEMILEKFNVFIIEPLEQIYMMYMQDKKEFIKFGKEQEKISKKDVKEMIEKAKKKCDTLYFKKLMGEMQNDKNKS